MESGKGELTILWTSGELLTAEKMVLMYGYNALRHGWWKSVRIVIWGASAALVAETPGLQRRIGEMIAEGVSFSACRACAEQIGVDELLESIGVEVSYWGQKLTELIESGSNLITV